MGTPVTLRQNEKTQPPVDTGGCASQELAPALGLEDYVADSETDAPGWQTSANSLQANALYLLLEGPGHGLDAALGHAEGTSEADFYALFMHTDSDLRPLLEAWDRLTADQKDQILAILRDSYRQLRTGT